MNIKIIFSSLVMTSALSGLLTAQETQGEMLNLSALQDSSGGNIKTVDLYFDETDKDRLTGSVAVVDAQREFLRDSRTDIGSAINGKVIGLFDTYNTWGTGNAVVVIDGVRQDGFYYNNLNMLEIETIVVLKDAISKALYGAMGDQGVVLINTKRGMPGKNQIRVSAQHSISQARALPNFLNASDYMDKYNEALANDGLTPIYSEEDIEMTRSGASPAIYPDSEFYTDDFLRDYRSSTNVIFDMSGGDQNAQYYVNTEFGNDNGWLNTEIPEINNYFNFRGNLDFRINDYMKMGVQAVARLTIDQGPNVGDYWSRFATILPNAYPLLWDPNLIQDDSARNFVLEEANLHDGEVLGGNSTYANNQILGDLVQNGKFNYRQSLAQFSSNLDVDLGFITQGLTAKGYAGMNFYNTLYSEQLYDYSIYEPVVDSLGVLDTVIIHGTDVPRDQYSTNDGRSTYNRSINFYGNLSYDRSFGMHDVSALAILYGNVLSTEGSFQDETLLHYGVTANYMFNKKYVLEGSLMRIGSKKLPAGDNFELAPAVGAAWIISEERFMDNVALINYLKLRGSYGISKNDNWGNSNEDYFRYANTYVRGGNFVYSNGNRDNNETVISTASNELLLQKREDISVGLEAVLLNNSLRLDLGWFQSHSIGNLTEMRFTYPQILGFEDLVYDNFNSYKTTGIEFGFDYTYRVRDDFYITLGSNVMNINPVITQIDEPFYEGVDAALLREGTASDALWALVADGLYGDSDFNPDGSLVDGLPEPTFGGVQPGDIKYLDQNDDGLINQLDQRIVGNQRRTQVSAHLDLRFRNIGFYILGVGRLGDDNFRNLDYFRIIGDVKYSEYALQAYGPDNKDVSAIHPRLTTRSGGNNDRNSSYWLFENNSLMLPTIQLTYHFDGGSALSFLKDSQIYVRGSNLAVLNKNKAYTEVNPYSAPRTRSVVLGILTSF
ncbi:MAG: SusC/RagA family TonB-linked outer membrane protein [Bacteroidales bacterium]